jgi:hypothetical protein
MDQTPELHMKQYGSKMIINLENFISDVEDALKKFSAQLHNPSRPQVLQNAFRRFDKNGIIGVVEAPSLNASHSQSTLSEPSSGNT